MFIAKNIVEIFIHVFICIVFLITLQYTFCVLFHFIFSVPAINQLIRVPGAYDNFYTNFLWLMYDNSYTWSYSNGGLPWFTICKESRHLIDDEACEWYGMTANRSDGYSKSAQYTFSMADFGFTTREPNAVDLYQQSDGNLSISTMTLESGCYNHNGDMTLQCEQNACLEHEERCTADIDCCESFCHLTLRMCISVSSIPKPDGYTPCYYNGGCASQTCDQPV